MFWPLYHVLKGTMFLCLCSVLKTTFSLETNKLFFHSTFCMTVQLADSYGGPVVHNTTKSPQHNEMFAT